MSHSKIEIRTKGESPSIFTEVFIGGQQVKGVRSITYRNDIESRIPTVTLDLNALDVSIDSPIARYNLETNPSIKQITFKDGGKIEFE